MPRRRQKGVQAHEAGRGRPVSSGLETPRPRGALENRIFKRVTHDLFKFTTADENGGLGGSVGVDLRAATCLTWATAATERGGHLEACIFIEGTKLQLPGAL